MSTVAINGEKRNSSLSESLSSSSTAGKLRGSRRWQRSLNGRLVRIPKTSRSMSDASSIPTARDRFIHAVRMVIILSRVNILIFEKKRNDPIPRTVMTFTEIADQFQSENMRSSGLSFDPNEYRAKKEVVLSTEVKKILNSPSDSRTPEQIQTALFGLQSMRSFAEYPLHMQEKLVKVAWYESIPPKRIIIRQGHYAENFYFIISGSVVVTILDKDSVTNEPYIRTAAVLRRGSSFGELALLHHSRRTATVTSQGSVQLLAIGREDFFDIFMRQQSPGKEPDHVAFIKQLPFMKHWPIEKLLEKPEKCLFHFFKRGQIIVKDSNQSNWIYVIKSGSCQVLRQLKSPKPQIHHTGYKQDLKNVLSQRKTKKNQLDVEAGSYYDESSLTKLLIQLDLGKPLPRFATETSTTPSTANKLVSDLSKNGNQDEKKMADKTFMTLPDIDNRRWAAPKTSYSRSKYFDAAKSLHRTAVPRRCFSVNNTVDIDHRSSLSSQDVSVFVQVEKLQPRDVFGLSMLDLDLGIDHLQSSVSLVSRGAECVMIHKNFFERYCTVQVKRNLRSLIRAYPTTESLQENLQTFTNWSHYKMDTVQSILRKRNALRRSISSDTPFVI